MESTILTKHQPKREQYWGEIERFFGTLPPHLLQHGLLLKNTLTAVFSDTGRWQEILCRDYDYPILSFHFWLLDDWQIPEDKARFEWESHIFGGMFFSFAATYLRESILDEDSPFDKPHLYLVDVLAQQATFYFAKLFPPDSPFWNPYYTCWHAEAEAVLATRLAPFEVENLAARLAPAKIAIIATALKTNSMDILPQLLIMLDKFNLVYQIRRDIATMRRDLLRGNLTYPIQRTLTMANLTWPTMPEKVLGAMILTGSIKQICQDSLTYLAESQTIARDLNLPSWLNYFEIVKEITEQTMWLFSLKIATPEQKNPRPQMPFLPYRDNLARAITMAEGYLLSDLTFRESWEVQRDNLLNMPEVVGRAFPVGLILEILCAHGHNLSSQVDEILDILDHSNFGYYANISSFAPDADDIGLALRLCRYATEPMAQRKRLNRPLRWLENNILPSGEIPIFWTKGIATYLPANSTISANSCTGTEINFLLGLLAYDVTTYYPIIENSALNLLDRFTKNGLSGMSYYDQFYTMWATFHLLDQLAARPLSQTLQDNINQFYPLLLERWAQEINRPYLTPQNLAWLTLTCSAPLAKPYFKPAWLSTILKQQRYDGSWDDEPSFPTPHRGVMGMWYSSRLLTTAFCYHALKEFSRK